MNTPPPAAHAPHSSKGSPTEQSAGLRQATRTTASIAAGSHQRCRCSDAARCRRRAISTLQTHPREVRRPQHCSSTRPAHGTLDTARTARAEPTRHDTRHAPANVRQGVGEDPLAPLASPVSHSSRESACYERPFLGSGPVA